QLFPWSQNLPVGARANLRNASALRAAIRSFQPEIVHSFSRLFYLLPHLARRSEPAIMSYQRHTGGRGLSVAGRLGGGRCAFTACSEFICRLGRPRGGSWHVIPNFVDIRKIEFQPEVPADAPLLFLSRIEEIKGPHLAISIARAAGRRLILAGNRATSKQGE